MSLPFATWFDRQVKPAYVVVVAVAVVVRVCMCVSGGTVKRDRGGKCMPF